MTLELFFAQSVVFSLDAEVALRMVADGADLGSFFTDDHMAAVAALPDHVLVTAEHQTSLDIFQKLPPSSSPSIKWMLIITHALTMLRFQGWK